MIAREAGEDSRTDQSSSSTCRRSARIASAKSSPQSLNTAVAKVVPKRTAAFKRPQQHDVSTSRILKCYSCLQECKVATGVYEAFADREFECVMAGLKCVKRACKQKA